MTINIHYSKNTSLLTKKAIQSIIICISLIFRDPIQFTMSVSRNSEKAITLLPNSLRNNKELQHREKYMEKFGVYRLSGYVAMQCKRMQGKFYRISSVPYS